MVISASVAVIYGSQENILKRSRKYALIVKAHIGIDQDRRNSKNYYFIT